MSDLETIKAMPARASIAFTYSESRAQLDANDRVIESGETKTLGVEDRYGGYIHFEFNRGGQLISLQGMGD